MGENERYALKYACMDTGQVHMQVDLHALSKYITERGFYSAALKAHVSVYICIRMYAPPIY